MKPNIEDVIADQSGGSSGKTFSIEEVEKHNKRVGCFWPFASASSQQS